MHIHFYKNVIISSLSFVESGFKSRKEETGYEKIEKPVHARPRAGFRMRKQRKGRGK